MPLFALLLAVSAFQNLKVYDEIISISANDWRYVDLGDWRYPNMKWRDGTARVHAQFQVKKGSPVTMMIVDRAGLERHRHGQKVIPIEESAPGRVGVLYGYADTPGEFIVVLKNDGAAPSEVRVAITIDSWDAAELSPQRRLAVLAISFAVFFGMAGYSAVKLKRVLKL